MRPLRRSIGGIAAALTLLALGVPPGSAAADSHTSPSSAQGQQGGQTRTDPPARKMPATPAGSRAPQSNARAGQVSCGQVITQNTVLRNDVGPCPGDGIVIGADNITLNLNGHKVVGNSDKGAGGEFTGIRLPNRTGVTVIGHPGGLASGQMATVTGFEAGVVIGGGSANTVKTLIVRDNIGIDDAFNAELGDGIILFDSASNRIVDNVVAHNGIFDGIGVLGGAADANLIQGNTVTDTVGPSDGGPAGQGVIVNGAGLEEFNLGLITGTTIADNVIRRNASAGSANINNLDAHIVDNTVENNGFTNIAGNGIGVQAGFGFRGNRPTRVLVENNEVHGNAEAGIQILRGASENRILNNDAANNNAGYESWRSLRSFDLHDQNSDEDGFPSCGSNVWWGNIWGTGLYNPPCTAAGGSGPPFPVGPEGPYGDPTCHDQLDNDQDGYPDWSEPDCQPPPPEPEGPPGDPTCSDGIDNDQDGFHGEFDYIDEGDPDCRPPEPEGEEFGNCRDRHDNDRDGRMDDQDPDCPDIPVVVIGL